MHLSAHIFVLVICSSNMFLLHHGYTETSFPFFMHKTAYQPFCILGTVVLLLFIKCLHYILQWFKQQRFSRHLLFHSVYLRTPDTRTSSSNTVSIFLSGSANFSQVSVGCGSFLLPSRFLLTLQRDNLVRYCTM